MFDNPKKSLQNLEAELLAAEPERKRRPAPKKEENADEALEEVKKILAVDDWKATHRAPLSKSYDPEFEEELWEAEPPRDFPTVQERGGIRPGLIVALVLEALGLAAVIAWWLL